MHYLELPADCGDCKWTSQIKYCYFDERRKAL